MGKGYLSVEKKSSADTVIRQDSHQDAPQVMRSRMTKEQQEAQMQQGARGKQKVFQDADADVPQAAGNNIMTRLRNAALSVKADRRLFGDSYRMKLVKDSIDRFYELQERQIEQDSDFDSLKILAVDIYMDLIRTCDEYLKARKKEGKAEQGQTGRYRKVRLLHECAKTGLRQIAGMTAADFRARFEGDRKRQLFDGEELRKLNAGGEPRARFGKLLEKDAVYRDPETDEARELAGKEMQLRHERNHAGLYTYQAYFGNISSDRQIAESLNSYRRLREKRLPKDEEGFNSGKAQLLAACDLILQQADNIIRSGAFLKKNKVRREQASKLKEQMVWERKRLSDTGFADLNTGRAAGWDRVWEGDQAVIRLSDAAGSGVLDMYQQENELYMKSRFHGKDGAGKLSPEFAGLEGQKNSTGSKGTVLMAKLLGVEELFASHKDVTMVNDQKIKGRSFGLWGGNTEKGYISLEKGITLMEAVQKAEAEKVDLIYSNEAIKQMASIQIMDTICGQVDRREDSLKVTVRKGSREGNNYLIIDSVMAVKNEYSFGTAGFDEVNKNASDSSLRMLFDKDNNRITIGAYDPEFAERVMSLDADEVIREFDAIGLTNGQKNALKDRLLGVQEALRLDKENPESYRGKMEQTKNKYHYYDAVPPLTDEEKKEIEAKAAYGTLYERQFLNGKKTNSYINPALVKDYGDKKDPIGAKYNDKYWDTGSANEYVDEEILNSVRIRNARTAAVRELVSEEAANADKIQEGSVHFQIIYMMEQYAALAVTGERAAMMEDRGAKMEEILNNLRGFEVKEPFRTGLLKMGVLQGVQSLEGYMVKTMRELIEGRLRELTEDRRRRHLGEKHKSYEEVQLEKYLGLISDSKGLLQIPPHINTDENELTVLDSDDKEIEDKNWRNAENEALFPHPPCIQDALQGGLKNCFWITALATVVDKDPEFIQKHMRDEGAAVVVKLYDDGKPFYVRVKKTVPSDENGNALYARGALWVQMYEKAVMLSGLLLNNVKAEKNKERFKRLDLMKKRSYSLAVSQSPKIALPIITGKESDFSFTEYKMNLAGADFRKSDIDRRIVLKDGTIALDDDFSLGQNIGEAKYLLKNSQRQGRLITASTRENFIQNTGKMPGGRESEERGLYSNHSYTVIGLETKNNIDYVRLRNPWGRGVVEEVRNPLTGRVAFRKVKDRYGTFVIDMKTFITYFGDITTGKL